MSTLAAIADAVVAELNGHQFALPFTAVRAWRPVYEREAMATLHVTVVPRGFTRDVLARGQDQTDYAIDVAVQQAPEPLDNAHLDPLMGLVEEIAGYFRARRPATCQDAICIKAALAAGSEQSFLLEHMDTLRQFTSILTLTFRVAR